MSDPVKPEDTKPVAAEPPKPAGTEEVAPVPETVAAPVTTSDDVTPVAADKPAEETAATEEKKEDDKPEPKEITQGTLSKFPSGLLAFFKTKRFFYFQDEPIPEDRLKVYLQKANSAHGIAAYASQTGKGLLLYSKAEGQSPHGIIKLADVTEVTSVGAAKFVLKIPNGGDLHFESPGERDSWVFTLRHKITEAKAIEEEIVSSDGYKATLEKLKNPTPIATAKAPEGPVETKEEKETGEAKPEEGAENRSASKNRKRTSVFGFRKKEKVEEKKEEKDEPKEEPGAVEPTTATTDAPAEVPVVAEAKEAEDAKPAEETKQAEKATEAPAAPKTAKRHSYFNVNVFNRGERKDKEVADDKKEEEAKPEPTEPKTEGEAAPAEVKPVDVVAPEASTAAEKSPASSPPKSRFYTGIFDRKSEKAEKEPETKPAEASTEPAAVPVIATDSTATPAEESTEATSPTTGPKEQKRKSSFFSPFKKEKKADDVKSDTEEGEPSSPKPSTSPVPKPGLLTLIRRASKAGKGKETESKEVVAPATVAEEVTPAATATTAETETPNGAPVATESDAIGEVVPETVAVGQGHAVQAAA
ncbi:Pleckstrin homology domain-domain-containing protein [Tuber borchii]|uniref:Pleckstrin homology domain-domain-containing protein n=1 Tax=Tuber borchii TaxID=42251 RepID=A0A2T7A3P1_TUBBO|nr:Pleckstrin homology domain-domain-containing protein [Tuber borchii]